MGDEILATDGLGNKIVGSIIGIDKKSTLIEIIEKTPMPKNDWELSVAIAPTKNNARFEWFLEKATEIGIQQIYPFISQYSERKVLKKERCEKILISAMKQSMQFYLPKLHPLSSLEEVIRLQSNGKKYLAYVQENEHLLKEEYTKGEDAIIFIGPEGGFSQKEVELALSQGTSIVSIGKNRLRTETAGIVATLIINGINS